MIKAFKQVFDSKDYIDFMNQSGFGMKIREAKEFGEFMETQHIGLQKIIEMAGYGKKQ